MKQYVQTDLDADREVANTLAALILGGCSSRTTSTAEPPTTSPSTRATRPKTPSNPRDLAYVPCTKSWVGDLRVLRGLGMREVSRPFPVQSRRPHPQGYWSRRPLVAVRGIRLLRGAMSQGGVPLGRASHEQLRRRRRTRSVWPGAGHLQGEPRWRAGIRGSASGHCSSIVPAGWTEHRRQRRNGSRRPRPLKQVICRDSRQPASLRQIPYSRSLRYQGVGLAVLEALNPP